MKTIKLFNEDPFQQECDATVVELLNDEEGRHIVVLDQTVFYALSGGQPGDTGIITGPAGEEKVVDTRYANDEKLLIYHYLENPSQLKEGNKVHCKIDWERRYRHMRLHSLIHITAMIFEQKYGEQKCIGSYMADKGRIDYEFFDEIDFDWLNAEVQKMIDEGHDISSYVDPEDENGVRCIWEMQPLGTMPCGGTHVKNSSEIGKIHLKRKGLSSQGQRIYCQLVE